MRNRRQSGRCWALMVGVLLVTLAALSVSLSAEIYQCRSTEGCVATINVDDGHGGSDQRKVIFRKGDVVSSDAGWIASTDDGWFRLRPRRGGSTPPPEPPPPPPPTTSDPVLPPFPGAPTKRGLPPPDLSWIGMYGLWDYDSVGQTAMECGRPECYVLAWGVGLLSVAEGTILDPTSGPLTPLLVSEEQGGWSFYSWWW